MATRRLWSVTTLIGNGVPKAALVSWAAWQTARYAVEKSDAWLPLAKADPERATKLLAEARFERTDKSQVRGTDVHEAIEKIALGDEPEVPEAVAPYIEQFRRFLSDFKPRYELAEATVYNLARDYAGTLDAIVEIDGSLYVLDVKTTDKHPRARSRPPYPEVAMQLAAYARAEFVGLGDVERVTGHDSRYYVWNDEQPSAPMPKVAGAIALAVSPYDYRVIPVDVGEETWISFRAAAEVARWTLERSKRVLGKPLKPPGHERLFRELHAA